MYLIDLRAIPTVSRTSAGRNAMHMRRPTTLSGWALRIEKASRVMTRSSLTGMYRGSALAQRTRALRQLTESREGALPNDRGLVRKKLGQVVGTLSCRHQSVPCGVQTKEGVPDADVVRVVCQHRSSASKRCQSSRARPQVRIRVQEFHRRQVQRDSP